MRKPGYYLFLILIGMSLALVSAGCSSTGKLNDERAQQMSTLQTDDPIIPDAQYQIRPGDEIEILVWEQPNFNTQTTVSSLGTITVPLVGEMQVTGMTQSELSRELTRELSQYIRGVINLTISIRNTDNQMISVFGMVSKPDNYRIVDQTSIFRVLSTAGGPTENANLRNVRVYRHGESSNSVTLDLTQYLESGQMNSPTLMVSPGDIVYIPKKENAVREMSEFLRDVVLLFGIFRIFN